jgi:hypothetical protein
MSLSPKAKQSIDYSEGDDFGNVFAEKKLAKKSTKKSAKKWQKDVSPFQFSAKIFPNPLHMYIGQKISKYSSALSMFTAT